jgi:osmotically-inducible protein OsmY
MKEANMITNRSVVRVWLLLAALLFALAGCGGTPTRESTGEFFDDTALTTKVKAALLADTEVSALRVNVETFKGVVQLSGFAKTYAEAHKAEQLARDVKGVKSVRNDIALR